MSPYLALMRPAQWVKNGFVLVGFLFGQRWQEGPLFANVLLMFAGFCLLSSAVYAINDVLDRRRDRTHPTKRLRPVAAALITPLAASVFAGGLAAAAFAIAASVSILALVIFAAYLALNFVYSMGAKHVPVLDVFMIAAGFMLRLLAGTLGIGIEPSQWLIICGFMITLCLGFAKRRAELMVVQDTSGAHRPVLEGYTSELLDTMIAVTASGVLVTYSLYTVSDETLMVHGTRQLVWTLPFVAFGVFRFLHLVHFRGAGPDPAHEVVRDPQLALAAAGWLVTTIVILWLAA